MANDLRSMAITATRGNPVDPEKEPSIEAMIGVFAAAQADIADLNVRVSAAIIGRHDIASVRLRVTTNVTLATDCENGDTLDSLVLVTGDRIFKDYNGLTGHSSNGIYVVQASGAAVRATDADSQAELVGATLFVREGTHKGKTYTCTTQAPITVDTTALAFGLTNELNTAVPAALDAQRAKGSDIASAATVNLAAATGDLVDVTGTTTITAFGTLPAGVERAVRFTGALVLTHNATSLILPGAANITTAANDVVTLRSLGSGNWVATSYKRASGKAVVLPVAADISDSTAAGRTVLTAATATAALDSQRAKGSDIASAATVNLAAATGDMVDVTGTTTITAFGTLPAGVERAVRFTGALVLTHNATSLILPGAANITTAANDVITLRSLGSGNWVTVSYKRASGKAAVATVAADIFDASTVGKSMVTAADSVAQKAVLELDLVTPAYGLNTPNLATMAALTARAEAIAHVDRMARLYDRSSGRSLDGNELKQLRDLDHYLRLDKIRDELDGFWLPAYGLHNFLDPGPLDGVPKIGAGANPEVKLFPALGSQGNNTDSYIRLAHISALPKFGASPTDCFVGLFVTHGYEDDGLACGFVTDSPSDYGVFLTPQSSADAMRVRLCRTATATAYSGIGTSVGFSWMLRNAAGGAYKAGRDKKTVASIAAGGQTPLSTTGTFCLHVANTLASGSFSEVMAGAVMIGKCGTGITEAKLTGDFYDNLCGDLSLIGVAP